MDLSALAKGYGVDVLAAVLAAAGFGNYLVDIGGEVRARGLNDQGVPWRIGVEVPDPSARGLVQEALPLKDLSLATSGDYRNFFEADGVRCSHHRSTHGLSHPPARGVGHRSPSRSALGRCLGDGHERARARGGLGLGGEQKLPVLFILYDGEGFERRANAAFEALGTEEG